MVVIGRKGIPVGHNWWRGDSQIVINNGEEIQGGHHWWRGEIDRWSSMIGREFKLVIISGEGIHRWLSMIRRRFKVVILGGEGISRWLSMISADDMFKG